MRIVLSQYHNIPTVTFTLNDMCTNISCIQTLQILRYQNCRHIWWVGPTAAAPSLSKPSSEGSAVVGQEVREGVKNLFTESVRKRGDGGTLQIRKFFFQYKISVKGRGRVPP